MQNKQRKNPDTGITVRKIRQGNGFGWFKSLDSSHVDKQSYNLFFKDGDDVNSFSSYFSLSVDFSLSVEIGFSIIETGTIGN